MAEVKKFATLYKNIIGDTQETINAIQRYIEKNQPQINNKTEEHPAASVNRILDSISSTEINNDIQKIINNM